MVIHFQWILSQYGSKSDSLSPKPLDMQAESWLKHSCVLMLHEEVTQQATAILPIKHFKVKQKHIAYSSENLRTFRKKGSFLMS